ncbi:DVUA0089 family protein [Pelomonas cellulosilytica]|uniref:DVUA0089 family protein n=1 Tax=Pelomonas cellulosilytica TaxID=2906762 RepID=A0ABS8XWB1_9BURK|nr:DVUA0089 family protein [Pelomonas sp. P8]MCE4555513.1 DVUA0089 family protein [Pelomonas sp. P8]
MRFLLALLMLACSLAASAGSATYSGRFTQDDELFMLDLTLPDEGSLSVVTDSFAAGGFAPALWLYDGWGNMIQSDIGPMHTCPGAGSFCWDAAFHVDLTAGHYRLLLSQSGNGPAGTRLSDGFGMTGTPDFTGQWFLNETGKRFINPDGTQRTGDWRFTLEAAAVPEPASVLLMLAGGVALLAWRRRGALLLGLGAAASFPALALEAPLAADTHVATTQRALNFGNLPILSVGGGSTALLRFDLGTLPSGTTAAKLIKANLVLYVNRIGAPGALELQTINGSWAEAGVTLNTTPPTSGAGSGINVPVGAAGQFIAVDVTNAVKGWITNPATNFGFALTPALSAPGTVVFLDSKQNTATAHVARWT